MPHSFREMNHVLKLVQQLQIKGKLSWVGARKGKESALFVTFILAKENYFNIWFLSHYIVYLLNF